MTQSGIENYITQNTEDKAAVQAAQAFVDTLKDRIDKVKEKDSEFKEYVKQEKKRAKRVFVVDSDLGDFLEE